jgi:hypothetical protein
MYDSLASPQYQLLALVTTLLMSSLRRIISICKREEIRSRPVPALAACNLIDSTQERLNALAVSPTSYSFCFPDFLHSQFSLEKRSCCLNDFAGRYPVLLRELLAKTIGAPFVVFLDRSTDGPDQERENGWTSTKFKRFRLDVFAWVPRILWGSERSRQLID